MPSEATYAATPPEESSTVKVDDKEKDEQRTNENDELQLKLIVKSVDMEASEQEFVISKAREAMKKLGKDLAQEKDIAHDIKKELDKAKGGTWHVVVGKSFGSYVTHEVGHFIYFYLGIFAFVVFKSG